MALHEPLPLPPELAEPEPGADSWVEALVAYAADLAAEASLDADAVGADLARTALSPTGDTAAFDVVPQARRWRVTDTGGAEWAMRHLVAADQQLAQLGEQADEWAARIRAWFDHAARPLLAKRAFMEAHLQRYALDLRAGDPKAKTLTLPSGVVKTTERPPSVQVADEGTVVAWALAKLPPAEADQVAVPQPRRLYVQPLREHTTVVEVIDHARLVLANSGELVHWVRHSANALPSIESTGGMAVVYGAEHERCPQPGDGWPTPGEATDLVARVEVLDSHWEVHGPDGLPVPGAEVNPGGVTAKVVPAP